LILVLSAFLGAQIPSSLFILGSVIGLLFSGAYLYLMVAKIGAYCLQCLSIDGVNLAVFAVSLWLAKLDRSNSKKITQGFLKNSAVIAGSVLFSVLFMKSFDQSTLEGVTHQELAQSVLSSSPVSVGAGSEYPIIGSEKAPITVVEFSDFQCPHCQHGAKILHAVSGRYPNLIKIVFRSYPLDPTCNPEIKGGGHGVSCEATKVSFCAAKQGKFKAVYESIFEHQADLAPGLPLKLAKELGLNESELKACVDGPEVTALIHRSIDEASRLGVKSTPTYFINGHKMEGAYPVPVWFNIIEALRK
jgi:protein-disulfide isomerase